MLKSMTGFGSSHFKNEEYSLTVEVKSLNSKFLDIQIKSPKVLSEKELDIRNIAADILVRGKINLSIEFNREASTEPSVKINKPLFHKYYSLLKELVDETGDNGNSIFNRVLEMPEVVIPSNEVGISEKEWSLVKKQIEEALKKCDNFRDREGKSLQLKISQYIQEINTGLQKVRSLERERLIKIREKMNSNLAQIEAELVDQNRLEQEIIFYSERLDVTEELVRLKTHLDHFTEAVNEKESSGKKLGFISQEIGREINTIGSKANYAPMQKSVVGMKDELEKIKEQTLNIL